MFQLSMVENKNNVSHDHADNEKADAFITSIEEEIRNENLQTIWDKYGKLITGASVAFLIAVGVYGMWQKQDASDREAISTKFSILQNTIASGVNPESYLPQLRELANVSKKDYAVLAKFEYAAVLRKQEDDNALAQYKSIFEDRHVNPILKELAYIFYVNTCLDLMKPSDLINSVEMFIGDLSGKYRDGFWPLLAQETLAFCYIKSDKTELAKKTLEELAKASEVPAGMAQRAKTILNSLG